MKAAPVAPPVGMDEHNAALRRAATPEPQPQDDLPSDLPFTRLSPREQQVLRLRAHGLTMADVGARLGITERTVKAYTQTIFVKVGASTTIEAVLASGLLVWNPALDDDGGAT